MIIDRESCSCENDNNNNFHYSCANEEQLTLLKRRQLQCSEYFVTIGAEVLLISQYSRILRLYRVKVECARCCAADKQKAKQNPAKTLFPSKNSCDISYKQQMAANFLSLKKKLTNSLKYGEGERKQQQQQQKLSLLFWST